MGTELPMTLSQSPKPTYTYDDYAQELKEKLRASQVTKEHLKNEKIKAKENYDKKTKNATFKVGEKVFLHDETMRRGRSRNLDSLWIEPYMITEKNSDVNYTIKMGRKTIRVNIQGSDARQLLARATRLDHDQVQPSQEEAADGDHEPNPERGREADQSLNPEPRESQSHVEESEKRSLVAWSTCTKTELDTREPFLIAKFATEPGIYFEKIGQMNQAKSTWKMVITVDVKAMDQRY
ncbi:retrovirus-like pol polyprotein [Lasius niger]|uniref:Retrovirus-like pol polyprotein n=1 Tax=Lasius niger TaxID=67767 RepID=A0A0J7KT18_LASNI|nr:retrovirus-like pol polyprotein [Lasius niger]